MRLARIVQRHRWRQSPPALCAWLSALAVLFPSKAAAQEPAAPVPPPPRSETGPFAPRRYQSGLEGQIDLFWARRTDEVESHPGFGIALGLSGRRRGSPWFLVGSRQVPLRVLDSKSASLSLSRHVLRGGLVLGQVDMAGGFGFSTFTVDVVHGNWSFGLLSPLATAGVALRAEPVRLSVAGYVEYLWRFTQNDFWLRGVSASLSVHLPSVP